MRTLDLSVPRADILAVTERDSGHVLRTFDEAFAGRRYSQETERSRCLFALDTVNRYRRPHRPDRRSPHRSSRG